MLHYSLILIGFLMINAALITYSKAFLMNNAALLVNNGVEFINFGSLYMYNAIEEVDLTPESYGNGPEFAYVAFKRIEILTINRHLN